MVMNKSSVFSTKTYVFSDSVLCLGKIHENPQSNTAWEERLAWFKSSQEYRNLDRIDNEPIEIEWNTFPGFNTLQLNDEVKCSLLRLGKIIENFAGRIIFMSMFNDISWESKDNKKECEIKCSIHFTICKKIRSRTMVIFGCGSERKWYSVSEDSPQGEWDKMADKMMITLAESGHPVFRATSALSRGQLKSKGGGKLSIHYCAGQDTITTVFRTNTSVNHGAVAEMCEEYGSYHAGRPVVGERSSSSFVPNVINTNAPLNNDDPAHKRITIAKIRRTN